VQCSAATADFTYLYDDQHGEGNDPVAGHGNRKAPSTVFQLKSYRFQTGSGSTVTGPPLRDMASDILRLWKRCNSFCCTIFTHVPNDLRFMFSRTFAMLRLRSVTFDGQSHLHQPKRALSKMVAMAIVAIRVSPRPLFR
jgi:hypothetical protein